MQKLIYPGFRPGKINPYTKFDLAAARRHPAAAEEVQGGKITPQKQANPGTDTSARQLGEFFRIQMGRIGLEVEVDYLTWPKFQDALKTRSRQIFSLGWVADYPDAQNFLLLFYGPNRSPGPNACNYRNPRFDRLYRRAISRPELSERIGLYHEMEDIVIDDCPWILTTYRVVYALHYRWLKNYKPNDFASGTLKYQRVDMALQRKLREGGEGASGEAGGVKSEE